MKRHSQTPLPGRVASPRSSTTEGGLWIVLFARCLSRGAAAGTLGGVLAPELLLLQVVETHFKLVQANKTNEGWGGVEWAVIPTSRGAGFRYTMPWLFALDSALNTLVLFFISTSGSFVHTIGAVVTGSPKFTLPASSVTQREFLSPLYCGVKFPPDDRGARWHPLSVCPRVHV